MASFNYSYNGSAAAEPGTLDSLGLYHQPTIGTQPLPAGMGTTEGRGYTRSVNPNELVSNQLQGLVDPNNPFIKQAQLRAQRLAQRQGRGMSSIASGNVQAAMTEAALPIASADAQTYGRAASENLGYMNENLMQERDISNRALQGAKEASMLAAGSAAEGIAMQLAEQNRYRMFQEGLAFEGEQAGLGRQHDLLQGHLGFGYDIGRVNNEYSQRDSLANNDMYRADWSANQDFTRDIARNMANARIANSSGFMQYLTQAAIDSPDVYDPVAYSGMMNFYSQQFDDLWNNMDWGF